MTVIHDTAYYAAATRDEIEHALMLVVREETNTPARDALIQALHLLEGVEARLND